MKQILFITVLCFSVLSQAEVNFRVGSNSGESKFGDVNSGGQQSYFFSGTNMNMDLIFYFGRLGFGARYTKLDTIRGQDESSTGQSQSQSTEVNISSARLINSGLSALVSLRFYSSESETDIHFDKGAAGKLQTKTFGDLIVSAGKSNQFQMNTKDESGITASYTASNVDNYSASLLGGFQVSIFQLGFEAGYREMYIHDAHTKTGNIDREGAYKIGYPFVGLNFGLAF
jgi:hypothetical protein